MGCTGGCGACTGTEKDVFRQAVGRLLETHIREVGEAVCQPCPRRFFPEVRYEHSKLGPDLAVLEDEQLAIVEVSSERVHFENTVLGGRGQLDRDIDEIVVERAEQLERKIRRSAPASSTTTNPPRPTRRAYLAGALSARRFPPRPPLGGAYPRCGPPRRASSRSEHRTPHHHQRGGLGARHGRNRTRPRHIH